MSELNRYKIDVAALQETKWFGDETYRVGNCMVLTAGRKLQMLMSQGLEEKVLP